MDFPGGSVPFTSALTMVGGPNAPGNPMPCYRTIDSAGVDIQDAVVPHPVGVLPTTNIQPTTDLVHLVLNLVIFM